MRFVAVVSIVALGLTAAAVAATSAKDPSQLILARTDFPAGVQDNTIPMEGSYTKALAAQGIKAKATGLYVLLDGKTNNKTVSGSVTTTQSPAKAQQLFTLIKKDPDYAPKPGSTVALPAYGDDQFATYDAKESKAGIYVLKGSTLWQLEVDLSLLSK